MITEVNDTYDDRQDTDHHRDKALLVRHELFHLRLIIAQAAQFVQITPRTGRASWEDS